MEMPDPIEVEGPDIADLVCEDIQARKQIGIKTYGMPLRAGNGRPALRDAYAEWLDFCHYIRQELDEREALAQLLEDMAAVWSKAVSNARDTEEYLIAKGRSQGLLEAACAVRGNHPDGS
jgi:hypothetical protein